MTVPVDDTIIAISTPIGYSGLGVVRLSGKRALPIARLIFRPRGKRASVLAPRALVLGDVYDIDKKEFIDEAYIVYLPSPRSYTGEDIIEISCHGSPVVLEEIVRLGIKSGARHAHPGEFTLRAYLNGRIDIIQAEAVNDLITAVSLKQAEVSIKQLRGGLSRRIDSLRRGLVRVVSELEAGIEFPDENLGLDPQDIIRSLDSVISALDSLIESYESGRAMAEGINLAIVGRANVGKSTLFNALLDEDRAIVSPYPGTTRDYLRESIKIRDSVFHLIDMAGLERPSHPVEEEGIKKGEEIASRADGILFVLDGSRETTSADLNLVQRFRDKKGILVFNKSDLPRKIDRNKCRSVNRKNRWIEVSALKGTNLSRLEEIIHETFVPAKGTGEDIILHLRQKSLLEQIRNGLDTAVHLLQEGHSEEICAEEVRRVFALIGQLTGEIRIDEVIDDIFSRFCVGK
jgi:tRNA modification GTPase